MKFKWYISDINARSLLSSSVSVHNIQGFNVPCFDDFFYFKISPYDLADYYGFAGVYFDTSSSYTLGKQWFKFFKYDDVLFYVNFGKKNDDDLPLSVNLSVSQQSIYGYGILNPNKYYLYVSFNDGTSSIVSDFSDYDLDVFLFNCAKHFSKIDNFAFFIVLRVVSFESLGNGYFNVYFNKSSNFGSILYPSCCVLDYSPIVQLLGGSV